MKFNRANKRKQLEKAIALMQSVLSDPGIYQTRSLTTLGRFNLKFFLAAAISEAARAVEALN